MYLQVKDGQPLRPLHTLSLPSTVHALHFSISGQVRKLIVNKEKHWKISKGRPGVTVIVRNHGTDRRWNTYLLCK